MKNNYDKNIKGFALLQALMVTAVVGAAAGVIMSQMRLTENTLQVPRIRSEMLIAESAFRNFAYMNGTYFNASAGSNGAPNVSVTGSANQWLAGFESKINNLCPPGGNCEIKFVPKTPSATYIAGDKFDFDKTTRRMKTQIVYTGANIKVSPIDIDIVVPDHILTGAPFRCAVTDPGRPFFRGFDGVGNPICTGWPAHQVADGARCPNGEYMSNFDVLTMQITCRPLTANPSFNCGGNPAQYISNINWGPNTGGTLTFTCAGRPNPFTYFSYNEAWF